jgi:hypothetical protein
VSRAGVVSRRDAAPLPVAVSGDASPRRGSSFSCSRTWSSFTVIVVSS